MFWGILVHAGTVAPVSMFQRIGELSGLVRMESFFLISGLLSWMILNKHGTAVVLKKRALVIGLPFAVSLLLLNPLTNWLIHNYHNPPQSFGGFLAGRQIDPVAGPINWHLHLWFLAALIVYTLLAPWIKRGVDVGMRFLAPKSSIRSEELRFLALSTAVVAGCLGARIVFEFALEAWLPESLEFVARSVGNYLPFYALGMLLSAAAGLRGVFSQVHLVQTTLA
jgi:glucan biosynthesis protein C